MLALAQNVSSSLEDIHADVWHAHALGQSTLPVRSTGDAALDLQRITVGGGVFWFNRDVLLSLLQAFMHV